MSAFCPEGYEPTPVAVARAMQDWYPEYAAEIEKAMAGGSATKDEPGSAVNALALALSQSPIISETLQYKLAEIVTETAHRLRNYLHQGDLRAYHFGGLFHGGRQTVVECGFWATPEADGVLESGFHRLLGRLFVKLSELNALLNEQQSAAKRAFTSAKMMSELVAAYREPEIVALPNRKAQRKALSEREPFRRYRITESIFEQAEKESGRRDPGVKKRQPS